MKRNRKQKLVLDQTTIRSLSPEAMKKAAGGQTLAGCSAYCSIRICPDTQFIHGCGGTTTG